MRDKGIYDEKVIGIKLAGIPAGEHLATINDLQKKGDKHTTQRLHLVLSRRNLDLFETYEKKNGGWFKT